MDYGDRRSIHIANHAQVYMLKSIASYWKQPISFTFSKRSTKVADVGKTLNNNIQKCQECGFEVVSTSGQGSILITKRQQNYLTRDSVKEYEYQCMKYYYINKRKILHLYDTPRPLKGISKI